MGWMRGADSPQGDDEAEVRAWLRAVIAWIGDTAVIRLPEPVVEVVTEVAAGPAEKPVETPVEVPVAEPVRLTIVAA